MIYLDYNATSPISPQVREAMLPYLTSEWGNPSSTYRFGSNLKAVVEAARQQVATLIGATSSEILFTSGASESNSTAIHAALKANPLKRHLITSAVEHSSVLSYCRELQKDGFEVTYLPVDREGLIKLDGLEKAITGKTALVSLIWANNETGVLFPVRDVGEICRSRGVLFHCDAVQVIGKTQVDLHELHADYLSITGHKFNAPKGIGALYVRRKAPFSPLIHGGHQERGRRGGTENVAMIVGLGKAAELAAERLPLYDAKLQPLREALEQGILSSISGTELNGHADLRLPNTTNITFHGIQSEALLLLLDQEGVCASSGSACLADSQEASHVVVAMKPETCGVRSALRFSLGFEHNAGVIEETLRILKECVAGLRSM